MIKLRHYILFVILRNHWGSGLVPYTIDAAFTTSERAVIAQGIKHVEENSCLRYEDYSFN